MEGRHVSTMPQQSPGTDDLSGHLPERLIRIEARIARLEKYLDITPDEARATGHPSGPAVDRAAPAAVEGVGTGETFEFELGQNWFAKVGIVVLALGVVFLLTLPHAGLPSWLPSLAGLGLAGGLVAVSRQLRTSYLQISRYLMGGALLLLYFAVLRLSFFGAVPALPHRGALTCLLLGVGVVNLVVAARRQSTHLAATHLALGGATALVADSPVATLGILVAVCAGAMHLGRRLKAAVLPGLGLGVALLAHAIWAFGNPPLGHPMRAITGPEASLAVLFLYVGIGLAGALFWRVTDAQGETPGEMAVTVVSGVGSYLLLLLLTLTSFKARFVPWNLAASLVYLACAIAFWMRFRSHFSTFVFAMLGYGAMSAAIVHGIDLPGAFVWLCWESTVVVSTAVWFRSRFIVTANFVIFLGIFAAYLLSAGAVTPVSIGFGLVALATARILNWQRDRLELRTEVMRNAYLATALFVIPYSVYHAVPRGLVSLAWLGIAAAYYVASRILNNAKYRWMALLTMALTIVWVFTVDLVALSRTLRVVSFLALGVTLLAVSMAYSRRRATTGSAPPAVATTPAAPDGT